MRGGKTGFRFNVQKSLCQILVVNPLQNKAYLENRIESCHDKRKSSGHAYGGSTDSRKKGSHGNSIHDVLQSTTSSTSSSSIVQIGTLPQFVDHGESLLPIGLYIVWLTITIFTLGAILHYSIISNA